MNIRISTKGKRPMRSLTPSDKVHAIQRIHDGESKASVARDIGVPESTLRGWCKNEDKLRFMSRQAAAEKIGDPLSIKFEGTSSLGGPPDKRQRVDSSMVLNFSNKLKFDELNAFKRAPMNGLDFGNTKALTELSNFNTLAPDYVAYNGTSKSKIYGADISRQTDPSLAAVSPLSSLTNLSGLTGLGQSPLAISFSELTSNLNLLAQLNPGLAAMSGLTSSGSTLRNMKQKSQPQGHSPRSDPSERQTGLTVKNWAKQKPSTPNSCESSTFGINLCQNDAKGQIKNPSGHLVPPTQIGPTLPTLASIPDDPLLYWLKSQQALLGFNNLYSQAPTLSAQSPPIRSSTPQQQSIHATTPPIIPNPLTPSSTPSGSLDDKNSAWFNWCKAFGASLSSLTPAAAMAALQATSAPNSVELLDNTGEASNPAHNEMSTKGGFENILYSHLTKDSTCSQSPQSSPSPNQLKNELTHTENSGNRPEDLSAKSSKARSPQPKCVPNPELNPEHDDDLHSSIHNSPNPAVDCAQLQVTRNSVAECRDVLDNLLYKINNNPNTAGEPDASFSDANANVDDCTNNNNNNSNKTNEEEWKKCPDIDYTEEKDDDYSEAIKHGEKFLQWLEKNGDARVTAVQMMQLRYLISSIKRDVEDKYNAPESTGSSMILNTIEIEDSCEESERPKARRRK